MGYDNPRSLGVRETGGGLSLPIWITFMEKALKGVPVMEPSAPEGVVNVGGEWYYEEYARGGGVGSLGVAPPANDNGTGTAAPAAGPGAPGAPRAPPGPDRPRRMDCARGAPHPPAPPPAAGARGGGPRRPPHPPPPRPPRPGGGGGRGAPGAPSVPYDRSLMNSDGLPPNRPAPAPSEERRSILDLFRN